jgi:rubrerythrin
MQSIIGGSKSPPGAHVATDNLKMSAEEWKELAQFWRTEGDALSLYFKAPAPTELAHREDVIYAKDKIKEALGKLRGNSAADRSDIGRILGRVAAMKGNGRRARVIFACARQGLWREFDLGGDFALRLDVGCSFTLAPLMAQQQGRRRYCIALADRNRARLLLLENREISEHSQVLDEDDKEKIRTTGTSKSVHLERKKEEKARRHFSSLADHLLHFYEHEDYDYLIVGCRDEMWPEIEAELHPQVRRILVGRFATDPGFAGCEEIEEKAQAIVDARDREDEERMVEKIVGAAAANALGAVGLKAVISALEKGEVRTLLWTGEKQSERRGASLCENCGHLEAEAPDACPMCGARMRRFADAEEALLRHALGRSIEVRQLHYAKLPQPESMAAWLRFRAEINTPQALAS